MTEQTAVIAYLVVAAVVFVAAVPFLFRLAARDFGEDRDAYATMLIVGLLGVAAAAMVWPLVVPVLLLRYGALKYWDRVHIRR